MINREVCEPITLDDTATLLAHFTLILEKLEHTYHKVVE